MNIEQLYYFVNNPHELNLSHAETLEDLSNNHPYSSIYTLLYLTSLSNGKSIELDLAMQKHAYKLSDRTNLYYLIQLNQSVELNTELDVIQTVNEDIKLQISPETNEIIEQNSQIEKNQILNEEVENSKTELNNTIEVNVDSEKLIESKRIVETQFTSELKEEENSPEESINPEENINQKEITVVHEVSNEKLELNVDVSDSSENHEIIPIELHDNYSNSEAHAAPNTSNSESVDSNQLSHEPTEPEVRNDTKNEPQTTQKSFTTWLKRGVISKPTEDKVTQTNVEIEKSKKSTENETIETFLRDEPKIGKVENTSFTASVKAKESIDDASLPVSETLAKIFASQGNYPKAIHVYHQLMLAIPEKRSLFALQIEELKKKIK